MKNLHVLLVHGADGLPFVEDSAEAEKRGAVAHALQLPVNSGHPIDGCHAHYDSVSDTIAAEIAAIREQSADAVIAAIGRNLGGSLLAYHAARRGAPYILVMTGAIPDLARFRAKSDLEGGRNFRAKLSGPAEQARIMTLADLDLVATLPAIQRKWCLLQAGTDDPWMDATSWEAFDHLERSGFAVERFTDGHEMVSDEAVASRWDFIEQMASR